MSCTDEDLLYQDAETGKAAHCVPNAQSINEPSIVACCLGANPAYYRSFDLQNLLADSFACNLQDTIYWFHQSFNLQFLLADNCNLFVFRRQPGNDSGQAEAQGSRKGAVLLTSYLLVQELWLRCSS